jgi:hypothetical protein
VFHREEIAMLTKEWSDRLLGFFKGLLDFYKKFLALEREKYNILISGRLEQLDGCMKREQAFSLKARGLEQKRQDLLKEAGEGQSSFRELIGQTEPSLQPNMRKIYSELSSTVSDVQRTNKKCSEITHMKLGYVSQMISKAENGPELKQIYGKKQGQAEMPEDSFSKKV